MRDFLYCVVVLLLFLPAWLGGQTPDYADHLFNQRKFPAAILEYERYLYQGAGNEADSLYAQKKILAAYYGGGMYDQLAEYSSASGLIGRDREFTSRFLALGEFREGRYEVARLIPNPADGPNSLLLIGIADMYLNRTGAAKASFAALPDAKTESAFYDRNALLGYCESLEALPQRSTLLAGTLALVPGLGYAYNGKWQTALSSLFLHAAFFASAWELRRADLPISSAVVALMGTAYYLGSIYGSASEALKHNQNVRKKYLDSVLAPYINSLEHEWNM